MAWNKQQAEYNITELKLTHSFALKMASIISFAVMSVIVFLGIFFGAVTPITLIIIGAVAIFFSVIVFSSVRSAIV